MIKPKFNTINKVIEQTPLCAESKQNKCLDLFENDNK